MKYTSTTQTVLWFRDRYREGTLDLRKPYQRKPVWMARQKCFLVETMLLGLPIPEVFMELNVSTSQGEPVEEWGVIDGQQRIRAILQFIGSETDEDEAGHNGFALDKLLTTSPWLNMTFNELPEADQQRIWQTKLAVRELTPDMATEVGDMFRRLNKFLTPLNGQELRNATYSGPFIRLAETLADDEYWAENGMVTPAQIRRMNDIEFVSELLIGVLHGPQGGSAKIVDDYYAQYEDYDDEFPGQRSAVKLFRESSQLVRGLFPAIREGRWGNKTDFYSLFVACSYLLRGGVLPPSHYGKLRQLVSEFGHRVDERLANEDVQVGEPVATYVRAVARGANDKARRASRHAALCELMEPYFKPRKRTA